MFRKKQIKTLEQYNELYSYYENACNTLSTASTQGHHYLLISFLRSKYGISANGREEAMRKARQLLDGFDFSSCDAYYADLADQL